MFVAEFKVIVRFSPLVPIEEAVAARTCTARLDPAASEEEATVTVDPEALHDKPGVSLWQRTKVTPGGN